MHLVLALRSKLKPRCLGRQLRFKAGEQTLYELRAIFALPPT
jgi:hypothetical protein